MVLPLRQIHLDFHTSEHIFGVGSRFDPDSFVTILRQAHVNSVTCFSRCHHGWLYYPSQLYPERIHPGLEEPDLLGKQIEACHRAGIRVPVYLPLQWDHLTAKEHPEWLVLDETGRIAGNGPYEAGFYRMLCLNTPYVDFVITQALELLDLYEVDGFFLDIINSRECSCSSCLGGMVSAGLDPAIPSHRRSYMLTVIRQAQSRISSALWDRDPKLSIFYNHSHVRLTHREHLDSFSHLELESLPSGGWGYWDFPISMRYARTLGIPCLGMTGKFHSGWGDFHSLKREVSLEFECFRSLALGGACSIGDQMHPTGVLSRAGYERIGRIYGSIEEKEEWCRDVDPLSEIAVLSPDRFEETDRGGIAADIQGCARFLEERFYQFDIVDEWADFTRYGLLILPDNVAPSELLQEKLHSYLDQGGAVFSTFLSGLDRETRRFIHLPESVRSTGELPWEPDFFLPDDPIGATLPGESYVLYTRGWGVSDPEGEMQVLAWAARPYFNRTWKSFCSHMHAPSDGMRAYPVIYQGGRIIHACHPLFTGYHEKNPEWYGIIVDDCIRKLLGKKIVESAAPSSMIATVNRRRDTGNLVLHLLHYIPEYRGGDVEAVHDRIPLYNVDMQLRVPGNVFELNLVPLRESLPCSITYDEFSGESLVQFTVPELSGHQMVEVILK